MKSLWITWILATLFLFGRIDSIEAQLEEAPADKKVENPQAESGKSSDAQGDKGSPEELLPGEGADHSQETDAETPADSEKQEEAGSGSSGSGDQGASWGFGDFFNRLIGRSNGSDQKGPSSEQQPGEPQQEDPSNDQGTGVEGEESGRQGRPERPTPKNGEKLPDDFAGLVERFQDEREALLNKRKAARQDFVNRIRDAIGEERQELIEELRARHEEWRETQQELREEFRDRIQEIRDEFKNRERDKIIDEIEREGEELRERLGED